MDRPHSSSSHYCAEMFADRQESLKMRVAPQFVDRSMSWLTLLEYQINLACRADETRVEHVLNGCVRLRRRLPDYLGRRQGDADVERSCPRAELDCDGSACLRLGDGAADRGASPAGRVEIVINGTASHHDHLLAGLVD